ncbi:arginine-tRNA-protein transferase [Spirosoma soli]|uniref:Arginine-tRNA-protein transferase n=1 Tax=Spirosoma soli TaxID=1770529 RepID=A0ABW5MCW6_9BACT
MDSNELDLWLSRGYFRMQQRLFTCPLVHFDDVFYSVHWLRIVLADVTYGKDQLRLFRINAPFTVTVGPFSLTEEVEALYRYYRNSITFDAPDTVESCLLDGARYTAFDTYSVEVRDENKLIAVGIFDKGFRSIAGIMNFYHPAYRKHSLGKYLMLQKMRYAQSQDKTYYYPGYLVNNYPKFDYKLFACEAATEVLDSATNIWHPFSWEAVKAQSAVIMHQNRQLISQATEF